MIMCCQIENNTIVDVEPERIRHSNEENSLEKRYSIWQRGLYSIVD